MGVEAFGQSETGSVDVAGSILIGYIFDLFAIESKAKPECPTHSSFSIAIGSNPLAMGM